MRKIIPFVLILTLTSSSLFWGFAAADSRRRLLTTFIVKCQQPSGGYIDTPNGTTSQISEFVSYGAVYLLQQFNNLDNMDQEKAKNWFRDRFDIAYNSEFIPEVFYTYKASRILQNAPNGTLLTTAVDKIIDLQNGTTKGFASSRAPMATVYDTYFAIEFLFEVGNLSLVSADEVAGFIMSTWKSNGFAGSSEGDINPADTYYALKTLSRLGKLNLITADMNKSMNQYIDAFYCDNENYPEHYGGYSFTAQIPYSTILLTYYSIGILKFLNGSIHADETLKWLLDRQNPKRYGFQDINTDDSTRNPTISASYFAVVTIMKIEGKGTEGVLREDIWILEPNPWELAGLIIGIFAGAVLIGFAIWKYKNR
jgi:prenyltransferase beta subunit